jgi:DNA-binding response OmpR family regulator
MTTRVLLLDDNDASRLTLAALLETDAFEVTEASSLSDARQSLAAAPVFDLALLDQHLGDGQGVDLIPMVRAQLPNCKIIIVSGSDHRPGPRATENADAFFRKGEDFDELLATIHALTATPASR